VSFLRELNKQAVIAAAVTLGVPTLTFGIIRQSV
jgi:hypothetical protein